MISFSQIIKGMTSEGQTTEIPTFVISENCLRSTTNAFAVVFDQQVNQL